MKQIRVVLAGQPNVGKSSLINALSGAKLRVGNFSGVTVEKAQAQITYQDYIITMIDLPGTYSLYDAKYAPKITLTASNTDVFPEAFFPIKTLILGFNSNFESVNLLKFTNSIFFKKN